MSDIAEIRPGSHSLGFVKTNSTQFDDECMSIVGTEAVIDLQFINKAARDIFAEHLYHFVVQNATPLNGSAGGGLVSGDNNSPSLIENNL